MTNVEFWEQRRRYIQEMSEELLRVQMELDDKGIEYCGKLSWEYSKYWMSLKTTASDGCRILSHYFACKDISQLKETIAWVVNETKFYEATAFVEGHQFVTFRCQKDIDLFWDEYYGRC